MGFSKNPVQSISVGPQGNAVFPFQPFTHFNTFSKVDVNSIYYKNASGVMLYFMYSGSPEITLEAAIEVEEMGGAE